MSQDSRSQRSSNRSTTASPAEQQLRKLLSAEGPVSGTVLWYDAGDDEYRIHLGEGLQGRLSRREITGLQAGQRVTVGVLVGRPDGTCDLICDQRQ